MPKITFISTRHKKHGKCNADELCKILKNERPEVVFLEALETTYSLYDETMFDSFRVYHHKLEIEALQKLSEYYSFKYVPVLDEELSLFEEKYNSIPENRQLFKMRDELCKLESSEGFEFLNSHRGMTLHSKMRELENTLLINEDLKGAFNASLETYENSMMQNIYSYCTTYTFEKAVFMCGSAHRESLIKKIDLFENKENLGINWVVYGD